MNHDDSHQDVAESLSSITRYYEMAKSGDEAATRQLWDAYSKRLLGLARAVLRTRGIGSAEVTEDSVVNATFAKFFDALANGRYQEVADRHELWRLLAVITRNHALNQAKKHGNRVDRNVADSGVLQLHNNSDPTSEEIAALSDMIDWVESEIRTRSKSDEQANRIIRVMNMTLSGHTQKEIAAAIDQSEVTVRRNLGMIRQLISKDI